VTPGLLIALCAVGSLVFGIAGMIFGNIMGSKVAITRIETWIDIREGDIEALRRDRDLHRDDLLVHDIEIGSALAALNIARVRRQSIRG
jgi:hypothetical protein